MSGIPTFTLATGAILAGVGLGVGFGVFYNLEDLSEGKTSSILNLCVLCFDALTVELTEWGAWSPCSHTCGGGQYMRRRSCSGLKAACQVQTLEERQTCNADKVCPSNYTGVFR